LGGWALGIGQKTLVTCDKRAAGDNNTPECSLWPTLAAQSPAVLIMNELVVDAIHRKLRMSVTYHGAMRIIEPQCYGIAHTGNELVRVHQIRGGSQREPLFNLEKMTDITLLDEHFTQPGPNYKKNDSAMKIIFAQL